MNQENLNYIMKNGIKYQSRLDKILSAFYMISETSCLSEEDVITCIESVMDSLLKTNTKDLVEYYDSLLVNQNTDSKTLLIVSMSKKIVKRIMFFRDTQNIEVYNNDLLIFVKLLKVYGLHNFT